MKNFINKLEDYSVSIERLTANIDLVADMLGNIAVGKYDDDLKEKSEYIARLELLVDSISELAHYRNKECGELVEMALELDK